MHHRQRDVIQAWIRKILISKNVMSCHFEGYSELKKKKDVTMQELLKNNVLLKKYGCEQLQSRGRSHISLMFLFTCLSNS